MSTTVEDIPTALIDAGANDRQRFDIEPLEALARSIAKRGLLQPITLRPVGDRYEIVAGERRFRAVRDILGRDTVEAIVRRLDDDAAGAAMLVENTGRVDLSPIEEARAYQARVDRGHTVEEIALDAGVRVSRVGWRLDLLRLIPEAQRLVDHGQITVSAGWQMHPLDDHRQRLALRAYGQGGLTAEQFADVCSRLLDEQSQDSMFDADDFLRVEEYVLEAQQRRLGLKGMTTLAGRLAKALADADPTHPLIAEALEALK